MDEGNEKTPDVVLEEQESGETSTKPNELEHVFVIILLGLLGIGAFLLVVKSDALDSKFGQQNYELDTEELLTVDTIFNMNTEILGLYTHAEDGQYFTKAENNHALYVIDGDECIAECLRDFTPYISSNDMAEGNIFTVERPDTGAFHYTWKGRPLYTQAFDQEGTTLGLSEKYEGIWQLARP